METPTADQTFVIVGTAPTWKLAPWRDPQAVIAGLNDAYLLGLPRYDVWYDIHPFDKMFFRPAGVGKKVPAHLVPAGAFVRPEGHLQWLAKQRCPVFTAQPDPRVPHAKPFPRAEIVARFGDWFDSSPAWMLAHAMLLGFKRVNIVGIHLASQQEYIKQKGNMCYLIGLARGMGITVDVPDASPLLQSSHSYAFEEDPAVPVLQVQRVAEGVEAERQAVEQAWLKSKSWRHPQGDPILRSRRAWLQTRLADLQGAVEWETLKKRATMHAGAM
jgi:hypothetical protein